jgi:hypothetical protein
MDESLDALCLQDLKTLFFKNEMRGVRRSFLKELREKLTFEEKGRLRSSKDRIVKLRGMRFVSFACKMVTGFITVGVVMTCIVFLNPGRVFYGIGFGLVYLFARKAEEAIRKIESDLTASRQQAIKIILSWHFGKERLSSEANALWGRKSKYPH